MTQTSDGTRFSWQPGSLRFQDLLTSLFIGAISGIIEVAFTISLGSLIFSGDMATYMAYGIGMALITSALALIGIALFSRIPGVIGVNQDSVAIILSVVAASLAAGLSASPVQERFLTILAAIATATLLTGTAYLLVGYFQLGRFMRFIPYPVVGGFLAGTGWLLLQGSIGVMTNVPLTLANLPTLFQPGHMLRWGIGVLFALAMFVGTRRFQHNLALPAILVGALVVFYLGLAASGLSITEATQQGLLLGESTGRAAWQPLSLQTITGARWGAILGQAGSIGVILFLSLVNLLLNASGLELALRQDVDLNRELKVAGVVNLISGVMGGIVGFHTLSQSILSYRMGARSRLPGITAGLVCLGVFLAGPHLLAYLPPPVLGGMLLFLGLDMLYEWVITNRSRLPRTDYAIVLLILVVIATTDFLIGVGVGMLAMVFLFVVNYSRVSVVAHAFSGAERHSNVERSASQRRTLDTELGSSIHILELNGFIFFGTANLLLDEIRRRASDPNQPALRFMLLDFRRITGMDSSAALSFVKARQLAEGQGFTLVLSHLGEAIHHALARGGLFDNSDRVLIFADLDRGLEYCEEQLLALATVQQPIPLTLETQLANSGLPPKAASRLRSYLERVALAPGDCLICQGEPSCTLYFIESGAVSVYLQTGTESVRVRTLRLGTAVGELSFLLGSLPIASVVADSPAVAYRLTQQNFASLQVQEPELASEFHRYLACLLSERVISTTRTLEAALR